ncbi:MAG: hypothetical protein RM021_004925 [Nostoc sp. EkiNYC01]|nr:hypothetical protein [Nostoc sp. EkiNYC01]
MLANMVVAIESQNPVEFNIVNKLAQNIDEVIYVVPQIVDVSINEKIFPFVQLHPGPNGGSQPFTYKGNISVLACNPENRGKSSRMPIKPGELLSAKTSKNGGLELANNPDNTRISPKQAGVENKTNPAINLTVDWYIDDQLVLSASGINQESVATFQLERGLFFYVAAPLSEQNNDQHSSSNLYVFPASIASAAKGHRSNSTLYVIPFGTNNVTVLWLRENGIAGKDKFTFSPPSATP